MMQVKVNGVDVVDPVLRESWQSDEYMDRRLAILLIRCTHIELHLIHSTASFMQSRNMGMESERYRYNHIRILGMIESKTYRSDVCEARLDEPTYAATDAARFVGMKPDRVRRWLKGYSYEYHSAVINQRPVISSSHAGDSTYASFLDLVDLLFAKRFLDYGISLQKLRKALDEATRILDTDHFARENFFTDGRSIYLSVKEHGNAILELLSGGQWVIPGIIKELAHQIEFDRRLGFACKWFPLGPEASVVLDPMVAFGRPTVLGKGILTANVYDFFLAEDRQVRATCRWLELTQREVNDAVHFEERIAA